MRLAAAILAATCALLAPPSFAQGAYPQKPIRLIVPSPPGDGSDLMARAIGDKLTQALGQPIVVDNRQGAGGRVGTEAAAKAAPDGYTLIMGNAGSHGINAALYRDLPYDIERDFVAITQVMRAPNVLVINPSLPAKSVAEFIALLKGSPGKYSYGSGGNGSSAHFTAELFKSMAGVDIAHIPYKGATPALTDVIGGQVAMFMGNLPPAMGHIKAGRVRALAVTTAQRSSLVPDLPTIAEAGLPGFETVAWFGLFAPAGTAPEIVVRLRDEVAKIVQQPDIRERIVTLGGEPVGNTPAEFAAIVRGDVAKWKGVAKAANIVAD
ncbi:MAG: tripartite tricarboxylate transporter substrate binding protein [Betaproteobacteria bacterium]|nr:tripartite tricarboxylate transporter substrate binding protein [Betaproteobacteria bacterium]MDH5286952.1 tripartite tricarboxylate transporter substrate binding protein [Betaproteobacteria bacterium]